jgi:hypothetical protein
VDPTKDALLLVFLVSAEKEALLFCVDTMNLTCSEGEKQRGEREKRDGKRRW